MSGIAVTEDAVNLYYYLKAKQVVRRWRCISVIVDKQGVPSMTDSSWLAVSLGHLEDK